MSNQGRIWFNGGLRESNECMVHVASHALHYGSSVFEGIRAYDTPGGTMIFRGRDHLQRLKYSADVYRIPMPYSIDELHAACRETVRDSGLKAAYIRPLVARGNCGLGVIPKDMSMALMANASQLKYLSAQLSQEVCYEAANLMGGAGACDNTLMHDLLGISRIQEMGGGTRQIQQYIMSMALRQIYKLM